MKIITPGLAEALTPRDWTPEQLRRRERPARVVVLRLPRLPRLRLPHVRVHLPSVRVRHRTP